ncbi:hypothetical protein ACFJGV_15070 [Cnuibacter sp. UC19_7]
MTRALDVAREERDKAVREADYLRAETERLSGQLFRLLDEKENQ